MMVSGNEPSKMVYRAVLQYATSGDYVTAMKTDWLPYKDMAEEIVEDLGPEDESLDGVYKARIERKEVLYEQ